jgi:peptide deformylase
MSVLEILRWPDARLNQVCAPVAEITPDIEALAQDLLETMYAAPGRGLAAPQVGAMIRMFVMDVDWKVGDASPMVFINPTIEAVSETDATIGEGCLSIPDVSMDITRPDAVELKWRDGTGQAQSRRFTGFEAVCVQHEMDHLDGVLTLDHLDVETRARVLTSYSEVSA